MSKITTVLFLPLVVFLGGAWLMSEMGGRTYILNRLAVSSLPACEKKPLNQRLGYDKSAVARYWNTFDQTALKSEQYLLELDLVFPLIYSAAFVTSLVLVWAMLDRPFNAIWIVAPAAVVVLADWAENLTLIGQLKRFRLNGDESLQASMIKFASLATCTKLITFCTLALFIAALVALFLMRAFRDD